MRNIRKLQVRGCVCGAVLFVLSGLVQAASPLIIKNNSGGSVDLFFWRVEALRRSGERVIFAGRCDSACALFLTLPPQQLCLTENARFGFHKAFTPFFRSSTTWSKNYGEWLTRRTFMAYPKWVQDWIVKNGGMSDEIKTMPYSYAARHLPDCEL